MKFTIRDLLLVTVIVALGLGRWVDRRRLKDETLRALKSAAEQRYEARVAKEELERINAVISKVTMPSGPDSADSKDPFADVRNSLFSCTRPRERLILRQVHIQTHDLFLDAPTDEDQLVNVTACATYI